MSVSLQSTKVDVSDYEWTTLEIVFIRIGSSWMHSARFPVYSIVPPEDNAVGYDAAVCVQKYEPWVIEAYNTSVAPPSILRIVEKGNGITSSPSGNIRGPPIENMSRYLYTATISLTLRSNAFMVAHSNGVQQMLRFNYEGHRYEPSPTVSSTVPPR